MTATPTSPRPAPAIGPAAARPQSASTDDADVLREIARRVLWLSASIVDAANRGRPNDSGVKAAVTGVAASMVDIMVAL